MFNGLGRTLHKAGHAVWVQMQESGAIMSGTRVQLDWRETGDRYQPSPFVAEDVITEDYTIHETETVRGVKRA